MRTSAFYSLQFLTEPQDCHKLKDEAVDGNVKSGWVSTPGIQLTIQILASYFQPATSPVCVCCVYLPVINFNHVAGHNTEWIYSIYQLCSPDSRPFSAYAVW